LVDGWNCVGAVAILLSTPPPARDLKFGCASNRPSPRTSNADPGPRSGPDITVGVDRAFEAMLVPGMALGIDVVAACCEPGCMAERNDMLYSNTRWKYLKSDPKKLWFLIS
jgi:hypothetical protein